MNGTHSAPSDSAGSPEHHHIRLACQACQRKKIKCDRNFPCGQCTRSSLQCTPSTRKPRARHTGKRAVDSELRSRISKLENLVESLSGEVGGHHDDSTSSVDESQAELEDSSPTVGKYVASSFWSSLTTEVQALKEVLEEDPADEETEAISSIAPSHSAAEYDFLILPPGSVYVMPGALNEPSQDLSAHLFDVFCDNVDRMYRIFHIPTLRAFMIDGKPYLGQDHSAPCNKALKAAIWYSATNTLTDRQCHATFGRSRADQVQQFRRTADVALAQADLMCTTEIATLQAFSIYLVTTRAMDPSRRVWTLTTLAFRIARAIGLHHESIARSPFETEMRRRLWHNMRFLDVSSALDRGSELLIGINSYDTPIPKNTNDAEFDELSTTIPEHETGLTDMSFALMTYDATAHTHHLTIPESRPNGETWKQRLEFAEKFGATLQEKYLKYCDTSIPFQRLLCNVASAMISSMMLRAVRPMQKHISSVPPRVDTPYVLSLAVNALQKHDKTVGDPETERWRCLVWVQWHALAIAIAGLCSIRDTDLAKEAWPLVEKAYIRNVYQVADARNGMLWRPIERLYKKASAFRDHVATPSSVSPTQRSELPPLNIAYAIPSELDPSLAQPNHQVVSGSMPMDGVLNGPMDVNFNDNLMNGIADLSWMDFERIWEDISNTNGPADVNLGDLQWQQQQMAPTQSWPCSLPPNMM